MEEIVDDERLLVRSWASDLDPNALLQATRTAGCAALAGPVALMPDAHLGLGATVGSVIPTESAIIPAAVGVDIGCGMVAVETSLEVSQLPDDLNSILSGIAASVPAGFSRNKQPTTPAWRWIEANPLPRGSELPTKLHKKAAAQLGTLGGGNHFVEVCRDQDGAVWAVLHSGSRGVGNELARGHIADAKRLCADLHRAVEDKDLSYFLDTDPAFGRYIDDMLWAQRYAYRNRELMMDAVLGVLRAGVGRPVIERQRINCHHNYTEQEVHGDRRLWITRKGAIRARVGDRGVIPGSMGTSTYIVSGLGNPDAYHSAAHGAGRRHSRTEAKRRFSTDQLRTAMSGRVWQDRDADKLIDESPMAYKDISQVMVDQADLVRVDRVLEALVNYKGT